MLCPLFGDLVIFAKEIQPLTKFYQSSDSENPGNRGTNGGALFTRIMPYTSPKRASFKESIKPVKRSAHRRGFVLLLLPDKVHCLPLQPATQHSP